MYAEKLKQFENVENLAGTAWQHARVCDLLDQENFKDCSMHCFYYQQLFELLLKHILATRRETVKHLDPLLNELTEVISS